MRANVPYDFSIGVLRQHEVAEYPPIKKYACWDTSVPGNPKSNFTSCVTVGLGKILPAYVLKITSERFETGDGLAQAIAESIRDCDWVFVEDAAGVRTITEEINRRAAALGVLKPASRWSFVSPGNKKDAKRQRILDAKTAAEELGILRFVMGHCEKLFDEASSIDGPNSTDDCWDVLGQIILLLDLPRLHRVSIVTPE